MNPEITESQRYSYFQSPAPRQLHQPPQFQHYLPYFFPTAPCPMMPPRIHQGIRRPRPEIEFPGFSGIETIPGKRSRNDSQFSDHGISPISMPVQRTHGDQFFAIGGAQEHSREFQETFEAEEDDDKADLHADHCSTNSPVDLTLGTDDHKCGLSEKVIQMTDPLTQIVFEIGASQLSQMLQKNGKLKSKYNVNSNEIKQIKDKFCMAKTLPYVTQEDVQMLQNAGVQIVSVTNRDPQPSHTNSRNQEYKCIICEVIEPNAPPKYLGNKENLKRHYHRHLNFTRFQCAICKQGFYRKDITRKHIEKEHTNINVTDISRYVIENT